MNNSSKNTEEYLSALPGWQSEKLSMFRSIIHDFIPEVREEIKWGVPTFFNGKNMMFAMAAFKEHVKFNFIYNGALLKDEDKLFNNGLKSKKARAIDSKEYDVIDMKQLEKLVKESVDLSII